MRGPGRHRLRAYGVRVRLGRKKHRCLRRCGRDTPAARGAAGSGSASTRGPGAGAASGPAVQRRGSGWRGRGATPRSCGRRAGQAGQGRGQRGEEPGFSGRRETGGDGGDAEGATGVRVPGKVPTRCGARSAPGGCWDGAEEGQVRPRERGEGVKGEDGCPDRRWRPDLARGRPP